MEQFLYPILTAFFAALSTWFFSRKSIAIDNQIKSASFYQNLLDDADKRINKCLEIIENLNQKVAERDKIIEIQDLEHKELQKIHKELMLSNESLISEIRKYKQLNGKS